MERKRESRGSLRQKGAVMVSAESQRDERAIGRKSAPKVTQRGTEHRKMEGGKRPALVIENRASIGNTREDEEG